MHNALISAHKLLHQRRRVGRKERGGREEVWNADVATADLFLQENLVGSPGGGKELRGRRGGEALLLRYFFLAGKNGEREEKIATTYFAWAGSERRPPPARPICIRWWVRDSGEKVFPSWLGDE